MISLTYCLMMTWIWCCLVINGCFLSLDFGCCMTCQPLQTRVEQQVQLRVQHIGWQTCLSVLERILPYRVCRTLWRPEDGVVSLAICFAGSRTRFRLAVPLRGKSQDKMVSSLQDVLVDGTQIIKDVSMVVLCESDDLTKCFFGYINMWIDCACFLFWRVLSPGCVS